MACIFCLLILFVFKSYVTNEDVNNFSVLLPFKRRLQIWVTVNLTQTWEGQDGLSQLARLFQEEIQKSKKRVRKFLVLSTAFAAGAALANSIQTAHTVGQQIDKEIMTRVDALESALLWIGKRVEAQKTHISLHCNWEHIHNSLCVTPLPWNETEQNWETIKNHLQGVFDKALRQDIHSLHTQLKEQLRDLQTLEEQKVLTDLKNDLTWVNPKNWFSGINLQAWVFIGLGCLAVISFLIFCLVLFNIIRAVKGTQKQAMVVLALSMTPKNKIGELLERGGDMRDMTWMET
uniref:Uncharacterized protein n=1 Tax=Corvus moneduloides TaxID=1196302 RepID=A0A8C3DR18_CORMO